jgi:N-acetylglucosaminyl-diphospho-decaprenol L-rhamnosyltransferase
VSLRRLSGGVDDIAIITISTNEAHWLRPCLSTVFEHMGELRSDVVVVDNESRDETAELVATEFPAARVVPSRNLGFSHGNNRGLLTCDARYVLFLNPDTEIVEGTFEQLVEAMDARPTVGLIGVRQVTPDERLDTTIRHFPNGLRALGDALALERLPRRPRWLGERELDLSLYDREVGCDWTSGSFLLVRREAIESAGFMDERYFMYSDETDFCLRIKAAGWEIRHLPTMTILHHDGKAGIKPRIESLGASSRMLYARKHFSPVHRLLYFGAVLLGASLRSVYGGSGERGRQVKAANRRKVATLLGRVPAPFGPPSRYSVHSASAEQRRGRRSGEPAPELTS